MVYLRLAFDYIFLHFKRFIISVLLVAVSLFVIIFAVITYKGQDYAYTSCDEILTYGMADTGKISIMEDEFSNADVRVFLDEAYKKEEISCVGDISLFYTEDIPELYEIQNKSSKGDFGKNTEDISGWLEIMSVDVNCIHLCPLRVSDGVEPDSLDFSKSSENHKISYLYLGSEFSSIPVGTEYKVDEYNVTYIVAGIMENNQEWIAPELINGMGIDKLDYRIDCSNGIIEIKNQEIGTSGLWIAAEDGYTINQAIDAAYEVARKYGITLRYATMEERYENAYTDVILIVSYLGRGFSIIIPAILLMLITLQIVSMILELDNYGIMYSVGFSLKDINIILVVKNTIMSMVAFVVTVPLVIMFEGVWFAEELQFIIKTVLLNDALPCAIVVLSVVIIITSLTAVLIIKRYTPVELIRKQD